MSELLLSSPLQIEKKCCRVCGCELIVGENWYNSQFKNKDYICNKCKKLRRREISHKNGVKPSQRYNTYKICRKCGCEEHLFPKKCRNCGCELILGDNWPEYLKKTHNNICKTCHCNNRAAYRQNNLAKIKESQRKFYQNNKEKVKIWNKVYRQNNQEKYKEYYHKYYLNNSNIIREKTKIYRQNNQEKVKESKRREFNKNRDRYRIYNRHYYWHCGGAEKDKIKHAKNYRANRSRKIELYIIYRHQRELLRAFEKFFPLYQIQMVDI